MLDFPIGELLGESICLLGLKRHLPAEGFTCPRCGSTERRLFRAQGQFPAYRCQACNGDDTLLPGTSFEKTRQRPATLVLRLRGMAQGEPPASRARWGGHAHRGRPCDSGSPPTGTSPRRPG